MTQQRIYLITYDIADPKRWRKIYRLMEGRGQWLQYSVFQCRLNPEQRAQIIADLTALIAEREDHVLIFDLGPADRAQPSVQSLGKRPYAPLQRQPVIV